MDPQVFNPTTVQGGIAILMPYFLEMLKNAKWFPWLDAVNIWRVRMMSMMTAVATSVGINVSFDPTVGHLIITGLTLTTIAQLLFQSSVQFKIQETIYRAAIKPHQDEPEP